jgi:hypothetical protein
MAARKFAGVKSGKNPTIYQRIFENSLPKVIVSYSDYRLISANPMACSLFGMSEDELCKHFLTDLVDLNDPRLINLVGVAEKTGKANGEITLVRKNGSKFTGEIISSAFSDEDGELIIVIVIQELTDRIKEEEELRKNLTLYQLAIDATNDGIWDMDMKTNRVFLSPNALNWFGFKEPKILHRDELLSNIIHLDDIPIIEKELNYVRNNRTDFIDIEFRVNTVTTGWRWIRLRGKAVLRESDGKIIRIIGTFADISRRKQTESELERSHKEYQSYFDNASVGLTVAIPDKSWIAVNEKACQMFGYSREELLKLSWDKLVHPDDIQEHLERYNLAIEGKIDKDAFETRLIRKDGRVINVYLSAECYRNEDGSAHHFLASHIDITEQKKYEETLRNERKILRTLVDNLPFTVYVIDKEGRKVISNKADLETIGSRTEAEVVGKTDIELFPGEIGQRCHADNLKVINTGSPILYREEDFFDSNGNQKWLQTTKVPLYNAYNKISGLIGIGIDITEQKKLQQKIIDSEAYYRALINTSPDGIIVSDLEGNITFHSKKMYQIFGAPENLDSTGDSVFNWVAPESFDNAVSNFKAVITGERVPQTLAYKCLKYDKTEFWGELSSSPLYDSSGKPKGLMVICRDITNWKDAEKELILALKKAEESDHLKTALLRNISHEIRTPMNAILGFSSFLGEPGISEETMMSYIETIQGSSLQLLSIIDDLLDISRIEAKIVKQNISELNLNEILSGIHNQFKIRATHKKIDLNITMGLPREKANIMTDRTKLIQIISNLLNNAIKFTDQGQINFGFTLENQFISFYVSDTGIGIPSQHLSKIFNPFFQVEHRLDRKVEGTGLGLSICKAYAELLGGTIWVSSEMGKGSSFYFTIPFKPAESPDLIRQPGLNNIEGSFPEPLTVLIAEDDENNSKYILNLISDFKVKTILAKNGEEAVAKCMEHKNIDLVFMDLMMPVMDGYEATRQIRSFLPDLPVIAQTAYFTDRGKAFENGCCDIIIKPFTKQEIISIIRKNIKKN